MMNKHILQVSELTKKVRFLLESELNTVWLCGEISNFIAASSGHWYLSLKDSKSQVKCAMFKGNNRKVRLPLSGLPKNGQQVLVRAKVSLYEPRGDFQLIIEQLEDAGAGMLRQQYEQLKSKLNSEGLFDLLHKKPIPAHIKTIGVITSPTGAAVKDILTVLQRRNPLINVIIYPTLVQGKTAKEDIAHAINLANQRKECDVLLIGRGGGSLEDLWSFNEEIVVRAIFNSTIPTISAVGHEIDTTLSDYAADIRAATPSAAAEIVSSDIKERTKDIKMLEKRVTHFSQQHLSQLKQQLSNIQHRLNLVDPAQKLSVQQQKIDELSLRLNQALIRKQSTLPIHLTQLAARLFLQTPVKQIQSNHLHLADLNNRLVSSMQNIHRVKQTKFINTIEQLNIVSPLATIARGYSVTRNSEGNVLTKVAKVQVNTTIKVQLSDGIISAKVDHIENF